MWRFAEWALAKGQEVKKTRDVDSKKFAFLIL